MPTDQLTWADPRTLTVPAAIQAAEEDQGDGDGLHGDETLAHLFTYDALTAAARTAALLRRHPHVPPTAPLLITPDDTLDWTLAALLDPGDGLSVLTLCQGHPIRGGVELITTQVPPGRVRRLRATVPWTDPSNLEPRAPAHWRVVRDGARVFVDETRTVAPGQPAVTTETLLRDLGPLRAQARRAPVELTRLRVWAAAANLLSAAIHAVLRDPLAVALLLLLAAVTVGWVRLPDPHRERALLARALARLHPER